jgi:hypothetical protein
MGLQSPWRKRAHRMRFCGDLLCLSSAD